MASSSILDALDKSFSVNAGSSPISDTGQGASSKSRRPFTDYFPRDSSQREGTADAEEGSGFSLKSLLPITKAPLGRGDQFRLNYDQETPLRSIDVGGPDQEQKLAEFVSQSIDNLSSGLSVKDAMLKLGLQSNKDILPGLEFRLLSHQIIGVAWMLEKEKSTDKGGILADDMGLGKTVQMIATMAMNPPEPDDPHRTTLIVVPAALLQQWKEEIETKSNGIFTVHVHHGRDKLKRSAQLLSKDVVITSYQTLCMDFSGLKNVDAADEAEWLSKHGGILARNKFHRIVADEAQFIRNRGTRASISLAHTKSKYRWMLTGTPVTNSLADIYGLLRFGNFRPWNDWKLFEEHIAKMQYIDAPLAGSRAQAILGPIILRRTKNSTLEGKPILQLPLKEIELVNLQFSAEERDIYDSFEKRTKMRLSKFIRERTLVKNHTAVLVMILRLRQLCCHPNLILSQTDGFEDPTLVVGSDAEKELGRVQKIMGKAWVDKVKKTFLVRAAATELLDFADEDDGPDANCPVCKDLFLADNGRVLTCGHEICFDCLLELSNAPIAHDGIFGYGNERENAEVEREFENAVSKGYRPCPTCKKMMDLKSPDKVFKSAAFEPSDEELTKYARSKRQNKSSGTKRSVRMRSPSPPKNFEDVTLDDSDDDLPEVSQMFVRPNKRQKTQLRQSDDDTDDDISTDNISDSSDHSDSDADDRVPRVKYAKNKGNLSGKSSRNIKGKGGQDRISKSVLDLWKQGDDDLIGSTKMLRMIDYLQEWESTGEKTICYSQWTSVLDLIEKLFSRHGIRNLRFDGKMDRASRDSTIAQFRQPGGPKVMLISTKCGSVGLNLVSANRIINMDLSWNYASESQAYDRCHRIGQDKTVYVKRLVVENTIEERMLKLQDVKTSLAEAALGEGSGLKLHKLSVKDIKYLFGMAPVTANPPQISNERNDE